jgi:cytochrome oxidase Cu insertion factor (SCO1/SenC/PrrC family)
MSGTLESGGGDLQTDSDAGSDATPESAAAADRAAALAEGAPGIPARFVWWVLAGALVLCIGGLIGEHIFTAAGLNPTPATTTTVPNATRTPPPTTPAPPAPGPSLSAALPAFMGLSAPSPRLVTPFSLSDQSGQPISVPTTPARVVVLSFFDSTCNDICPVLAAEMEQADADLGVDAVKVEFVTVNTDPSALAQSDEASAIDTGLGRLPNWHIVTGPLASLNSIWKSYGVAISVNTKTGLEAHSDLIDFIDPQGFLRYKATPFADESTRGAYTLPASSEARWAEGIATYASQLIGQ